MNSPETQFLTPETALDRDAYLYRTELLEIALTITIEEQSKIRTKESQRACMYAVIDTAKEAGRVVNNLEAIELLEHARDKILADGRFQSNYDDGTWDEHGNPIDYDNADKTGEQ